LQKTLLQPSVAKGLAISDRRNDQSDIGTPIRSNGPGDISVISSPRK
jgi:hypothetical protein